MSNASTRQADGAEPQGLHLDGRLHPVSALFLALRFAKHGLAPLLGAWVALKGHTFAWLMLGLLLALGAWVLLHTWRYRWGIQGGSLHIQEGVLGRSTRHIPLKRVVAVSQSRALLHRLLGVAEVHLESAAGGKPEAVMKVLSLAQAQRLKEMCLGGLPPDDATMAAVPDRPQTSQAAAAEVWHTMSAADVFKLGLVSHRGTVVVAVAMATIMPKEEFRRPFLNAMQVPLQALLSLMRPLASDGRWGLLLAEILLFALLAWALIQCLSVPLAFMRYHRFVLMSQGQRLLVQRGLSTQVNSSTPLSRLQVWRLRQTGLERLWAYAELRVTVPGDVDQEDHGLHASGRFAELAPLATWPQALALLQRSAPGFDWPALKWHTLGRRARARALWGAARWLLPLGLAVGLAVSLWPWAAAHGHALVAGWLLLSALVFWRQWLWVGASAWAEQGPWLVFRQGFWTREWTVVDARRLQQLSLYSSGLDRLLGLVHLRADTQGSRMQGRALDIPSLDEAQAQRLRAKCWACVQAAPQ